MAQPKNISNLPYLTEFSSRRISYRLSGLLDRWRPPLEMVLIGTALLVGIGTGLGAVAFRFLIQAVAWVGYVWIPQQTESWARAYVIFVPAVGGLLVGLLV